MRPVCVRKDGTRRPIARSLLLGVACHKFCLRLYAGDSCDLLIIDRPFDLVSTVMHEWSYEAMATDVLGMQNNVFQYEADTQSGMKRKFSCHC